MRAALVVIALAACVEPAPPIEPQVTSHVARMEFSPSVPMRVDMLFVVDSSPAMAPHLTHLDSTLPKLMETMAAFPSGLPDLHVGVVTANGDGQMRGRGSMTGGFLVDIPRLDGTRIKNYTGTLAEAVRAYVAVGAESASRSQPLAVIERALVSPHNAGFRRPGAYLAIVLVTASDDASDGDVASNVAALRSLSPDPSQILITTISGPRSGSSPCGAIEAPRLHAVGDQFPNQKAEVSICDDDFAAAVALAASGLDNLLHGCWLATPLDLEPTIPGEQRACSAFITDRWDVYDTGLVIPECGDLPESLCWRIVDDQLCARWGFAPLTTRLEPRNLGLPRGTHGVIECVVAAPSGQNP